jgi:hypothetical protein
VPQFAVQLPRTQAVPPVQGLLQAPQFKLSDCVFTQTPLHCVVPVAHDVVHCPLLQKLLVGHELPQVPQFRLSVAVFVQAVPHRV